MSSKKKDTLNKLSAKDTWAIAKWSLKILFQIDKTKTILYIIFSVINRLESLIEVFLVAKAFDILIKLIDTPGAKLTDMLPILLMLLGYNVLQSIFGFFNRYTDVVLSKEVDVQIEKIYYEKLHSLGIKTLEDPEVNNRITRAQGQIRNIFGYVDRVVIIGTAMISIVVNSIIILKFSPILIPIVALAALPSRLIDKKYRSIMWKFRYNNTEGNRSTNWTVSDLESTVTLPEIIINKAIKFLDKKYMEFSQWYAKEIIDIRKKWILGVHGLGILQDLSIYIGYLIIFGNAIQKKITLGDVYFQTRIIQKLSGDINQLITVTNDLFEYSLQMNESFLLFNMPAENTTGAIKLQKMESGPEIEFRDLIFSYPNSDRKIINKLNITIKPGEKVAIVGVNGAGKTTLMKLLSNIYEPTGGEILINGYPLKDIENSTWYDNLGVLFQEYNTHPQLTVKENIIMGNPNIKFDSKRMLEAAQNADAFEFIQEFPDKFDQVLSQKFEKGIRPSTGQWQKIAIARFFYRNAPAVIFDEPTAAIDAVSEYNIFNKIYRFFKNKTVIIISHRFSTVRNADRILVLDKGKIIEDGTHDELMKIKGKYANSFNLQAEGYK